MLKNRNFFSSLILFLALFLIISCRNEAENTSVFPETTMVKDSSWLELNLREKIGQIMCLNYNRDLIFTAGNENGDSFFRHYPVGSFFMANWEMIKYADKNALMDLYRNSISKLSAGSPNPLLFLEDFETGLGSAIPQMTALTSGMGLGAANSEILAESYGNILSKEARALGINWILNPVVDLNLNPYSFLTNVRSMGSDPMLVQRLSAQQILAMQSNGIAATAKHFPGDGTDPVNQHFTTSKVNLTVSEWSDTYGSVFKNAIDNGVMAIMPGHISFPAYQLERLNGEALPATLSSEIMTDLLKTQLGFEGVVVSDALNMAGMANYYENELETQIECFKAGADVLLWPDLIFMDTLEQRILRKEIPIERLNDAVSRVWNMKKKLGLFDKDYQLIRELSQDELALHQRKSLEISKAALTIISNKNKILPIHPDSSKNILLVVTANSDHAQSLIHLKEALIEKGFNVDMRPNLSMFTMGSELKNLSKKYDKIIFAFYAFPAVPWGSLLLEDEGALTMWSANTLPMDQVISVCFGDPYKNLIYMPRVWGRINCYGSDEFTQKALADLLVGSFQASGISPVHYE